MARHKNIPLRELNYHYHPSVMALIQAQPFTLSAQGGLADIDDLTLEALLSDITLHTTLPEPEAPYCLLCFDPLFEFLKQHPGAKRHHVRLYFHEHEDVAINTLNLIQPALTHQLSSLSLPSLALRQERLKDLAPTPQKRVPTKAKLAKWAGVTPSALRACHKE
ncbi:hypothetical protein [Vibrio agarivorans]|uniref:hypothetical protein n=1 Tax=Vibrio agarivorans TaxID=153622 RepID=UPI0025B5E699|nr:hypothetical protein [Vibrio agarivorans]MDN3662213.1 hypothetical protein [Vibrio agarivorans]